MVILLCAILMIHPHHHSVQSVMAIAMGHPGKRFVGHEIELRGQVPTDKAEILSIVHFL